VIEQMKAKDNEIAKAVALQFELKIKQEAKIEAAKAQVSESKERMLCFYEVSRFENDFLPDAASFFKLK
jgi:hypothetical protein